MENNNDSFQNVYSAIKERQKKHEEHVKLEAKNKEINDAILNKEIKRECSELYKLFIDTIQNEVLKDIRNSNEYKFNTTYLRHVSNELFDSLALSKYCSEFNKFNMKLIEFKSGLIITFPTLYIESETKLKNRLISDNSNLNFKYSFRFDMSIK